ncbi:hypothetical protein GCM10010276_86980 [Streptomyces longisporus]|uniref:Uncharacterized protein n=1 Tax=Streptomyces longisporus TaxID=1948 RepID=A0ABN3NHQ1_STRLO
MYGAATEEARSWPTWKRERRPLIAASAAPNLSKADHDPATWLPPAAGYRCTYAIV